MPTDPRVMKMLLRTDPTLANDNCDDSASTKSLIWILRISPASYNIDQVVRIVYEWNDLLKTEV